MSNLLQTVIPAAVTFLVGYQGALTRTSRLGKSVRADMDMLDAFPDGHPSRATLTAHVEELIECCTAVRRAVAGLSGRFGPILRACSRRPVTLTRLGDPMTPVQWEAAPVNAVYEDMVAVLLSSLHPEAERLDGSGGDRGRDVQLGHDGRLDLLELKSFAGRLGSAQGRRAQVERSLEKAAEPNPDSWTLVVSIDPTVGELGWFDAAPSGTTHFGRRQLLLP
jgi:hypothetical protein